MRQVRMRTGVSRKGHQRFPMASAKTGLFQQFTLGRNKRVLARIDDTRTQLVMNAGNAMPILPDQNQLVVGSNGYYVNPVRVFENEIVRNGATVFHPDGFFPNREPR